MRIDTCSIKIWYGSMLFDIAAYYKVELIRVVAVHKVQGTAAVGTCWEVVEMWSHEASTFFWKVEATFLDVDQNV